MPVLITTLNGFKYLRRTMAHPELVKHTHAIFMHEAQTELAGYERLPPNAWEPVGVVHTVLTPLGGRTDCSFFPVTPFSSSWLRPIFFRATCY